MIDSPDPHAHDKRYVWYRLIGDFDPGEISRLTGLVPDKAWKNGDINPHTRWPYKFGCWHINSRLTPSDEFDAHLDDLLGRLRPAWTALRQLGQRYEAQVNTAIYLRASQGPSVHLSGAHVQAICELEAQLDFDLYALPEEEPATNSSGMRLLSRQELSGLGDLRTQEPETEAGE